MSDYIQKYVEAVFRNSNSSGDLFDVFELALIEGIKDFSTYKILLGSHVLTKDEVLMYSDKLCDELKKKNMKFVCGRRMF